MHQHIITVPVRREEGQSRSVTMVTVILTSNSHIKVGNTQYVLLLVKYVPCVFSLFNIAWISQMPLLREHASTQHSRGFLLPEGQCLKVTCVSTCPVWIHTPLSSVLQCDCQVQGPTCDRTRLQKVMRHSKALLSLKTALWSLLLRDH